MNRAAIIGAGPNGLSAAIVLAKAGLHVDVYEAQSTPGGACRTMELTLPGFRHDFGSAVHPMAVGSPFFRTLPLAEHGLTWIHGDAPLAHPLDDGTAVVLQRPLDEACRSLGPDGDRWRALVGPVAEHWDEFTEDALQPPVRIPKHPLLMAHFAIAGLQSANRLVRSFRSERTRALFAGLAAHSFLPFDATLSSAIGLVLGGAAHANGWPIPQGGAQAITDALLAHLQSLGGRLHLQTQVRDLAELRGALKLCDITPRQLLAISGSTLSEAYRNKLGNFKYGPGTFKVDYALSSPVPWRAKECHRAITVHIGGSYHEIASSEDLVSRGRHPERPFVLLAQPTLFDPSRSPAGKHIGWAYCHVPNGSNIDMTGAIEAQIERFAPGFRDCVLARAVSNPARLESLDANLAGGDISSGAMGFRQFMRRPTFTPYQTSADDVYLCSASTPPGGGVHGMCGSNAARVSLRKAG